MPRFNYIQQIPSKPRPWRLCCYISVFYSPHWDFILRGTFSGLAVFAKRHCDLSCPLDQVSSSSFILYSHKNEYHIFNVCLFYFILIHQNSLSIFQVSKGFFNPLFTVGRQQIYLAFSKFITCCYRSRYILNLFIIFLIHLHIKLLLKVL